MSVLQRLNLKALRSRDSFSDVSSRSDPKPEHEWQFSRRKFLVLGGLATASLSTAGWSTRPFEIRRTGNRLSFWLGQHEVWVIDPEQFSGKPALSIIDERSRIVITLNQAFLPGTNMPAGFQCVLFNDWPVWKMDLHMACGIHFQTGFVEWLRQNAAPSVDWPIRSLRLSRNSAIEFAGQGESEFSPDWRFRIRGQARAELAELPTSLRSQNVVLSLGTNNDPSLTETPPDKRTLISIARGANEWRVPVDQSSQDGWRIASDQNLFDSLVIEAGETVKTSIHSALFTQAEKNTARLHFSPGINSDAPAEQFSFKLTSPRLALTLDGPKRKSALLANFVEERKWLNGHGFSLEVGGSPNTAPFELLQSEGKVESLKAIPTLFHGGGTSGGAAYSMLTFANDHGLLMSWKKPVELIEKGLSRLNLLQGTSELCANLENCTLSVIRTVDLLRLDFQFENLELKNNILTGRYLKPTDPDDPNKPPTITVLFPPQNVGEEAFYEKVPGFKLDYDTFIIPEKHLSPEQKKKLEPDLPDSVGGPVKLSKPPGSLPVQARVAEWSRLVFVIPVDIDRIPFKLASLLEWNRWQPKVHPVALTAQQATDTLAQSSDCKVGSRPAISAPSGYTSIELPYRLMLSPHAQSSWVHSFDAVDHDTNFTELWHTRLATRNPAGEVDERDEQDRTVRAIWSPDFRSKNEVWPEHKDRLPFRGSLDIRDRHELVHLTSNYEIDIPLECDPPASVSRGCPTKPYIPGAVSVEQMMLSSLGGWFKSRGTWEPPMVLEAPAPNQEAKILSIEAWRHIAAMGRDHYVRVVYKGYLMPFGHRASLIKVTERKIQPNKDGVRGAFLKQRMFIVVRQLKKEFPAFGHPFEGRPCSWRWVEVLTPVSPSLEEPAPSQSAFWPMIDKQNPFRFRFRKCDVNGNLATTSAPVFFVDNSVAFDPVKSAAAIAEYNSRPEWRVFDFNGQKISFAPSIQPGDTQYDTQHVIMRAVPPSSGTSPKCLYIKGQPFFFPAIETANINPAAVRRITNDDRGVTVKFVSDYLERGFDPVVNRGEVFLETVGDPLYLSFGGDKGNSDQAGGVITPNMRIVGFSRKNGAVGGSGKTPTPIRLMGGAKDQRSLAALPTDTNLIVVFKDGKTVKGKVRNLTGQSLMIDNGRTRATINPSDIQEIFSTNVSAVAKIQKGEFDPLDYFGGALQEAKILGGITLWDILKPIAAGAISNLGKAPKMIEETLFPALGNLVTIEEQVVALLDQLPPVATRTLGSELQEVRDSFAVVKSQQTNLIAQARFIRSITRLQDRLRAIVENPSALLDAALQQLAPAVKTFEEKLKQSAGASFDQWRRLHAQELARIESQLTSLIFNGLIYEEQIRNYVAEARGLVTELRSQIQTIIDLLSNPADLLKVLGNFLASEVSLLAKLEETRARLVTLVNLVKGKAIQDLRTQRDSIKTKLLEVQKFAPPAFAQIEQKIRDLETECLKWIASLPDNPLPNQPFTRRNAQQLVRQAVTAMRRAAELGSITALNKASQVQRQVLTSLQQLQTIVVDPTKSLLPRALATHPYKTLIFMLNDLANEFTIVKRAIDSQNLESLLDVLRPFLPLQLRNELEATAAELIVIRNEIKTAPDEVKQRLVTYQLQLFDLWLKYQDPFMLAVDVFGLDESEIKKLKALEAQYRSIVDLAIAIQTGLKTLSAYYNEFIASLPQLAQELLARLTQNAQEALAKAVTATLEEELLLLQQRAIAAIVDLYLDLMRRIQHPLEELKDLARIKDEFERMLKDIAIPDSVTLTYDWKPEVKNYSPVFLIEEGNDQGIHYDAGELTIKARLTTYLKEQKDPEFSIDGALTNFRVKLIGSSEFITIDFAHFKFSSRNGSKPHCDVKIRDVKLGKALEFVQKLQQLLSPSDKDGPFIELNLLSIRAGYRFGIPVITVGAMTIQHLRLIVAVNLPFTGEPMRSEFALSERHHPFLLSVGQYGGGGFLRMRLGLDGVEMLEGALEFGVVAAISIGIASGSGFVMAGIYFSVDRTESKVCGFVHANGHMDIIGLISIDLDVLVQICYTNGGKVEGQAQIVIHIEYMFFSIDIELHASYTFVGGGSGSQHHAQGLSSDHRMLAGECDPPTPKEPPAPDKFCDLSASEFKEYRNAFAW